MTTTKIFFCTYTLLTTQVSNRLNSIKHRVRHLNESSQIIETKTFSQSPPIVSKAVIAVKQYIMAIQCRKWKVIDSSSKSVVTKKIVKSEAGLFKAGNFTDQHFFNAHLHTNVKNSPVFASSLCTLKHFLLRF